MRGVEGSVKWFSNRKGFGFITASNNALTEEIFVHQTGIVTDGQFRTLEDDSKVKFDVEKEADSGRLKAVNVTNLDGSPIVPPPRQPRRARGGPKEDGDGEGGADTKENDTTDNAKTDDAGPAKEGGGNKNGRNRGGAGGRPRGGAGGGGTGGGGAGGAGGGGGGNNNRRNGRRNNNNKGEGNADGGAAATEGGTDKDGEGNAAASTREPPFHTKLSEDLRTQITAKGIVLGNRTTIDVALAPHARIKLGQGGYAGICLQTAIVGEGTYVCDPATALVTFTWTRAIQCTANAWQPYEPSQLLPSFSLLDENVGPVQPNETAATLWGADKPDPRDAFEANGFQMRRIVLTRPPNNSHNHRFRGRGGGRGGGGGGGRRNNKDQAGMATGPAE
ncbi:hypothetical protein ACA910_004723 [Epithemia clementina (nom. ined.)]